MSRLRARSAALALLCITAPAAHGQDASSEQDGRASDAAPEGDEQDSDALDGVPIVAYLPETGAILGGYAVYHFRFAGQPPGEPTSTFPVLAAVTTEKEFGVDVWPELFFPGKQYWLVFDLSARLVPAQSFFGVGNDTRLEDEELYRDTLLGLDSAWRRRVGDGLYLGVIQTLQWRAVDDVQPGGLLSTTRPPGAGGGLTSGVGPELAYDTRDNTQAPRRGSFVVLAVPVHRPTLGSAWTFTRVTLDARHFVSISGPHVLAFHVLLDTVLGTVPFDRMPEIASSLALRGYLRGRFRDRTALSFEVEYRFPIYSRFGGVVFAGIGQVAPRLDELGFDGFHAAGGVGLRFALVPEERIHLRLDVGANPDAARVYFAPGEAY